MINRHAPVKNETFALPLAVGGGDIFKIFQNAALEMIDLVKAHILHQRTGFFAANAASAIHCNFLGTPVGRLIGKRMRPFGKFAKICCHGIDRTSKHANRGFIAVAGINKQNIRIGNQPVPIFRVNIGSGAFGWINLRTAHCHNFALGTHFHPQEGLIRAK